jgi:hypothetical protein
MKTPTEHTPAPWRVEVWEYPTATKPHNDLQICSKDQLLCTLRWADGQDNPYTVQDGEARANAQLMAAAPELLEALRNILGTAEVVDAGNKNQFGKNCHGFAPEVFEQTRAAITKATNQLSDEDAWEQDYDKAKAAYDLRQMLMSDEERGIA